MDNTTVPDVPEVPEVPEVPAMRELPDFNSMAYHFEAFASGIIAHLEKLTAAVDDANFRTKLNKLDELTSNVDDIQQNMKQDLSKSLTESLTRVVEQIVAKKYKDLEALLRKELMNSIAAREANSIIRAANEGREDLFPLHSVSSNKPIDDFPKNIAELKNLSPSAIVGFLGEVGDPFEGGTEDERRDRLWMLSGVTRPQNFLFVR